MLGQEKLVKTSSGNSWKSKVSSGDKKEEAGHTMLKIYLIIGFEKDISVFITSEQILGLNSALWVFF